MTNYAELNWIKHPERTMQQLINARKNINEDALRDAIEEVLDQRFPYWQAKNVEVVASGQKALTYAQFRDKQKAFHTAKNAYVWLVEEILSASPSLTFGDVVFEEQFIKGAHGAWYLSLTPEELSKDHIRAKKDILWHELPNKWVLNLRLSNKQKFDRLCSLAAICGLKYEKDWSWRVEGDEESDLSDFDEILLDSKA